MQFSLSHLVCDSYSVKIEPLSPHCFKFVNSDSYDEFNDLGSKILGTIEFNALY